MESEYISIFIFVLLLALVMLGVLVFCHIGGMRRRRKLEHISDPHEALELLLKALNSWTFFESHETAGQVSRDLRRLESTVKGIANRCAVLNIDVNTEDLESVIEGIKSISKSKTWRFAGFGFLSAQTKMKYQHLKAELGLLRARLVGELRIALEEQKTKQSDSSIDGQ